MHDDKKYFLLRVKVGPSQEIQRLFVYNRDADDASVRRGIVSFFESNRSTFTLGLRCPINHARDTAVAATEASIKSVFAYFAYEPITDAMVGKMVRAINAHQDDSWLNTFIDSLTDDEKCDYYMQDWPDSGDDQHVVFWTRITDDEVLYGGGGAVAAAAAE